MGLSFRAVSENDVFENVAPTRGRQANTDFAACQLGGLGYVLTQDIDYVLDNSNNEDLPKLTTIRQRLLNHAANWTKTAGKGIVAKTQCTVEIHKDGESVVKVPVLKFWFNEGERKARKKRIVLTVGQNSQNSENTENAETTEAAE